jgi:hypothetical protein
MRSTKRAMRNGLVSCRTVGPPVGRTLEVAWSELVLRQGNVPLCGPRSYHEIAWSSVKITGHQLANGRCPLR